MTVIEETQKALREEMDKRGLLNNLQRAGLAALVGGESGWVPKFETGYAHTSNARIRAIFPSRVSDLSDDELTRIKSNDRTWFNFVYGSQFPTGRSLGNKEPDDGYNYRGGGILQITGRANYALYGPRISVDLLNHPELINTPRAAAATAVEYALDRFGDAGEFDDMKRAVGISFGDVDDMKNELWDRYSQSGEWNVKPIPPGVIVAPIAPDFVIDPLVTAFLEDVKKLQTFLKSRRLYSGPIDGDAGPGTRAGLKAYMKEAHQ